MNPWIVITFFKKKRIYLLPGKNIIWSLSEINKRIRRNRYKSANNSIVNALKH